MIVQGCSMSLFQASQRRATIWSQDGKILFQSQLSRMNCQAFSTGFSSGDLGGRGSRVVFFGTASFLVVGQPAWPRMRTPWAPGAT